MKTLVVTGGTGSLGSVVVPRLERDYRCVLLRRGDDPAAVAKRSAPVFGLVNLAGAFAMGSDENTWTTLLDANLTSFTKTVRAVSPHLEQGGRIVAISSIASLTKPPGLGAYVGTKAALNATIEVLAKELKERRITVNALLPDALKTAVPLENVASVIAFLLSDAAANVTGALIPMTA